MHDPTHKRPQTAGTAAAVLRPITIRAGLAGELPYPMPSNEAARATMRANKRVDSQPERRLRSALHAKGFRYRKDILLRVGAMKVHVDIVFPRQHLAIFMDGCFWHGCPQHSLMPKANVGYWQPKLEANKRRDLLVNEALIQEGWTVLRLWEHVALEEAVGHIAEHLRAVGT